MVRSVFGLGALVALLLWLLRPAPPPTTAATPTPSEPEGTPSEEAVPRRRTTAPLNEAPFPKRDGQDDARTMRLVSLIAEVKLDKRRACPGETIEARMRQLPEVASPVQYTIPGHARGDLAILRYETPGEKTVDVVASDGIGGVEYRSVKVDIVPADAPECRNRKLLAVTATISNADDDTAQIRVVPPAQFKGTVRYTYDFGDGASEAGTPKNVVLHKYALRPQREPSSTFRVIVGAIDETGSYVEGRASVNFRNVHWLSSVVGSPRMPVQYDRFPRHKAGVYTTELTVRNIEQQPIALSRITAKIDHCRGEPPVEKQYPIEQLAVGLRRIEPDQAAGATLVLPHADFKDACRALVVLEGDTIPPRAGTPVGPNTPRMFDTTRANVALELAGPPRTGASAAAAPVRASDEMARILDRATAILGPDHPITPEDLRRLKREGRLD